MTADNLRRWELNHRSMYMDLAENCGSVPELMLKIDVYGQKWTKWDWVLFFKYLVCQVNAAKIQSWKWNDLELPEQNLLDDVFETLDSGNTLDGVFTDKTVIMCFIGYLEIANGRYDGSQASYHEICTLLAHIAKKFPSIWKMNWMFIKKRSGPRKGERTHRLAFVSEKLSGRPVSYFLSQAFYDDFTHMYYPRRGTWRK